MSDSADILDPSPYVRDPWSPTARDEAPMTLDDLLRRFAVLPSGDGPSRTVRGTVLAVAQDWLIRLPAGKDRDQAIECLVEAADRACEALTSTAG